MKIYISGAITNTLDYFERFATAEEMLAEQGHTVLNPVKNPGFTYKEYIDMGLCELMHCDAIYLMNGYELSKGAVLEYSYAIATNMRVIKEKDLEATAPDTEKVVRCKDCRHWNNGDCYRMELSRENDFCSYGEKKEG